MPSAHPSGLKRPVTMRRAVLDYRSGAFRRRQDCVGKCPLWNLVVAGVVPGERRDHCAQREQQQRNAFPRVPCPDRLRACSPLAQPQPSQGERQQEQCAAAIERRKANDRASSRPIPQTRPPRCTQNRKHREQQQEDFQVG